MTYRGKITHPENQNKIMRAKERIPIVLENINWEEFIKDLNVFKEVIPDVYKSIIENILELTKYWYENPDERLTQVLVNNGIIPNIPGFWYYTEEDDYLIEKGLVKAEDIKFWGSYGKDGKGPLKKIAISNMTKEHLEACIRDVEDGSMRMNPEYFKLMKIVLNSK